MDKNKRNALIISTLKKIMKDSNFNQIDDIEDIIFFLGTLSVLINNKTLFKRNTELVNFLESKFEIKFAEYCKKSRPLMVGKTIKYLLEEENDSSENINELYRILNLLENGKINELTWNDLIKSIDLKGDF